MRNSTPGIPQLFTLQLDERIPQNPSSDAGNWCLYLEDHPRISMWLVVTPIYKPYSWPFEKGNITRSFVTKTLRILHDCWSTCTAPMTTWVAPIFLSGPSYQSRDKFVWRKKYTGRVGEKKTTHDLATKKTPGHFEWLWLFARWVMNCQCCWWKNSPSKEINGKTMKMLKTFHKQGTLGLGSVVRISPMYQPFMSHLEGIPRYPIFRGQRRSPWLLTWHDEILVHWD